MRSPRRFLAGVAAVVTICLVATGCDSSPYAASVNGQVIKQTSLNAQMKAISANHQLVAAVNKATSGPKVSGASPGSYSSAWSASVLTAAVTASAVHQDLVRTHRLPSQAGYDAARAVDSVVYGAIWYDFTPALRSTLVDRDADLARLVPDDKSITGSQLTQAYKQYETSFFTSVCVRTIDVDVTGSGGVDFPASLAKAKELVSRIKAAGVAGANRASFGGSVNCYSAADFEQQTTGLINTVISLKAGSAATPQKTSYGYQVVAVTHRTLIPDDAIFRRAVSTSNAAATDSLYSTGISAMAVQAVLAKAHVKVDPLYGTWKHSKSGYAVHPSSGPAPHAASVAGSV